MGSRPFAQKVPDELESYRAFVIELAESVGRSAGGGDEAEAATVERLKAALAAAGHEHRPDA